MADSFKIALLILATFFAVTASGHQNHHGSPQKKPENLHVINVKNAKYEKINFEYEKIVKPIFQKKCMDCHSEQTNYPFYYQWIIAKSLIDKDIVEAKKHIDMTTGFPFRGHGTPLEDFRAIKKSLNEGTMPPLRYKLMHWNSSLSKTEKERVLKWIDESLKLLED